MENYVLKFNGISKNFPGVCALNNVSFGLQKGEILSLIGGNGAGKSTLVKCVTGALNPDSGIIEVFGNKYSKMEPKKVLELGISAVYQEFNLVPDLPVCENIFMGKNPGNGIIVDYKEMLRKSKVIFDDFGIDINPKTDVKNLSLAEMQIVEIAKAVASDLKILILDEPTSSLTNKETLTLFSIIRKAKKNGVSIIYISHRLEEIFEICDRAVILRDGEYVDTRMIKDTSRQEIIRLMLGYDLDSYYPERKSSRTDDIALEVKEITGNGINNASFKLYKKEILGFTGLVGAGRTELMELVFGAKEKKHGEIFINGKSFKGKSPKKAIEAGIAFLTEDRKRLGLLMDKSVAFNITLANLKKLSNMGVINQKKENIDVQYFIDKLNIKTPSIKREIKLLSGGNQQKVIVAKWLECDSDIVIFDEPTQGIDVGAKHDIYLLIDELVESGNSVIVISSDLDEIMSISDRMYIMSEGEIVGCMERKEFNKERILDLSSGKR
ncbi:MAG: sugar ABC transporter ATP-binding protein [Erysipelotrichaceae bacterium]|jgi:ribose transport system ATP-binding protein